MDLRAYEQTIQQDFLEGCSRMNEHDLSLASKNYLIELWTKKIQLVNFVLYSTNAFIDNNPELDEKRKDELMVNVIKEIKNNQTAYIEDLNFHVTIKDKTKNNNIVMLDKLVTNLTDLMNYLGNHKELNHFYSEKFNVVEVIRYIKYHENSALLKNVYENIFEDTVYQNNPKIKSLYLLTKILHQEHDFIFHKKNINSNQILELSKHKKDKTIKTKIDNIITAQFVGMKNKAITKALNKFDRIISKPNNPYVGKSKKELYEILIATDVKGYASIISKNSFKFNSEAFLMNDEIKLADNHLTNVQLVEKKIVNSMVEDKYTKGIDRYLATGNSETLATIQHKLVNKNYTTISEDTDRILRFQELMGRFKNKYDIEPKFIRLIQLQNTEGKSVPCVMFNQGKGYRVLFTLYGAYTIKQQKNATDVESQIVYELDKNRPLVTQLESTKLQNKITLSLEPYGYSNLASHVISLLIPAYNRRLKIDKILKINN